MVGSLNGLALGIIGLKHLGVRVRAAFDKNRKHYKQQILVVFWSTRRQCHRTDHTSRYLASQGVAALRRQFGESRTPAG